MHFTLTYKKKALNAFRFIRSLANLKVQMKLQFTLTTLPFTKSTQQFDLVTHFKPLYISHFSHLQHTLSI